MSEPGGSKLTGGHDRSVEIPMQKESPIMQAVRRINPLEDLKALPQVPCARSSLLFGMTSAAGIGSIQIFSGRGIRAATNWTMATFLIVTVFGWETCRRSYTAEQAKMKAISAEYNARRERHAKQQ